MLAFFRVPSCLQTIFSLAAHALGGTQVGYISHCIVNVSVTRTSMCLFGRMVISFGFVLRLEIARLSFSFWGELPHCSLQQLYFIFLTNNIREFLVQTKSHSNQSWFIFPQRLMILNILYLFFAHLHSFYEVPIEVIYPLLNWTYVFFSNISLLIKNNPSDLLVQGSIQMNK